MLDLVKYLILPSSLIIICFVSGITLFLVKRIRRVAIFILAMAGMLYVVFGNGPVSFWLLRNLENKYPPVSLTDKTKDIEMIVILAGYAKIDLTRPISSEVNPASAFRIIEALRIYRAIPNPKILISGGGGVSQIMKNLLVSTGVPSEKVSIEGKSANTYDSAANLQNTFRERSFILVTSAGHMPRAMGVFHKLGMNPIPAPTDYKIENSYSAIAYLPSPLHLEYSNLAVYEYLGILWYKLRGRL